jgi:hypothetical protein
MSCPLGYAVGLDVDILFGIWTTEKQASCNYLMIGAPVNFGFQLQTEAAVDTSYFRPSKLQ